MNLYKPSSFLFQKTERRRLNRGVPHRRAFIAHRSHSAVLRNEPNVCEILWVVSDVKQRKNRSRSCDHIGGDRLAAELRQDHLKAATFEPAIQQVTPLNKPVRMRDRNHLRFVSTQPCLACGRTPSDAHHLRFAEQGALGRKVSDEFTVPLCRLHHRGLHQRGDELTWWQHLNVDPLDTAQRLWRATHQDSEAQAFQCET